MEIFAIIVSILGLAASLFFAMQKFRKTGSGKRAFMTHLLIVGLVFVFCLAAPLAHAASADGAEPPVPSGSVPGDFARDTADFSDDNAVPAETSAAPSDNLNLGIGMIAVALSIGLAGIGAGIAVASAAPAAIGATSEDPAAFGKAMIFVALGEAIALYGLVISIMILGKF